ncbi:hypothetical protein [Novosphingobium sp.]|uniref:hypothetical protein n=1 Tax=Novosphingobium sp. TaxID=1874826 RepID=UPI0032B85836
MAAPQHFVPPSPRELRAHAVQRLQAGLFGLSAIVLIVGLANIINDRAKLTDSGERPVPAVTASASPAVSDPLADIGVVPSAVPSEAPSAAATGAPVPAN